MDDSWDQDVCYVLTYTPHDPVAEVLVSGRKAARYQLSLEVTQQLVRFAEEELLAASTGRTTCDDCLEFEVFVRVGRRHNFFVLERHGDSDPPAIAKLFGLLGGRR